MAATTIELETKYLKKFHVHINKAKKENVMPWDITFNDVKEFFDAESKMVEDRTLYRKITIIALYFDFLWKKGIIPIDFMSKFRQRYRKLEWQPSTINIDYRIMLDKKREILINPDINLIPKVIYLFLLNAVTLYDMTQIECNEFIFSETAVLLTYKTKKNEIDRNIKFYDPVEIQILTDAIALAKSRDIKYIISSKSKGSYTTFTPANLHDMVEPIDRILGFSVKSTQKVIYAYAYYLANIEHQNINEICNLLGTTKQHALKIINSALERLNIN